MKVLLATDWLRWLGSFPNMIWWLVVVQLMLHSWYLEYRDYRDAWGDPPSKRPRRRKRQ
jgi:hypothetical protein